MLSLSIANLCSDTLRRKEDLIKSFIRLTRVKKEKRLRQFHLYGIAAKAPPLNICGRKGVLAILNLGYLENYRERVIL